MQLSATDWMCALFLLSVMPAAHAQSVARPESTSQEAPSQTQTLSTQPKSYVRGGVPRVPGVGAWLNGVNVGLNFSGVHNSAIGWYEVAVPAVSYSFSPRFSADISTPVYLHRLVHNTDSNATSSSGLVMDDCTPGDTQVGLHGSFRPHGLDEVVTVSLTAPSGSRTKGVGTGRVTFDVDNDLGKSLRQMALHLDLGMGDSSGAANNFIMQDYNSLGTLAHFQIGALFWIFGQNYIQVDAYEQLPIGNQKVYSVVADPSQPADSWKNSLVTVIRSKGLSEDNGMTVSLGAPLSAHLLFNSYYNHSLRQKQDTVSLGMTYILHGVPFRKHLSMIDRALREAAGMTPEE